MHAAVPGAHLVTPGIRPADSQRGDQQRISEPAQAIRSGAAQLVIGRPITQAENPVAAFNAILHEMAEAL
jgi:orotidine-5'-phosphate decarboxylase